MLIWVFLGGVVLVLAVIGTLVLLGAGSPNPVPAVLPAQSPLSLTPSSIPFLPATATPPTQPSTRPPATSTIIAVPSPNTASIRYRVRPGDTLTSIAEKYQVSIRAIMAANNMRKETVRIGEELIIPLPTPHP